MKAGKKLVGALSYFGGFSSAQSERKVEAITIINKETDMLVDKAEEVNGAIPDQDMLPTSETIPQSLDVNHEPEEIKNNSMIGGGAYDYIDVQNMPITEETLAGLED